MKHLTPFLSGTAKGGRHTSTLEHATMFSRAKFLSLLTIILSVLILSGCGGSGVESGSNNLLTCNVPNIPNAAGTACVPPPPIQCAAPTVPNATNDACVVGADPSLPDPVFFPGADQAVLYYNRAAVGADNSSNDPSYEGYRLHTWSNDTCNAYAAGDTDWANGRVHNGVDPNYGAYWILDLKPGYAATQGSCHNFIIHIGTDDDGKEMGGGDFKGVLDQDDAKFARMNFTLSGEPTVFEFPLLSLGPKVVKIEGQAAHWLDANTLVWDLDLSKVSKVKLHYSDKADLKVDANTGLSGTVQELTQTQLTDAQKAIAPHLAAMPAFQGNWSVDDAKSIFKTQAVLASYDSENKLSSATGIQMANAIDQVYTTAENDANEAKLGPIYKDGNITAAVWAPTAQKVKLKLYNADKTLANTRDMTLDTNTGVWSYTGGNELNRALYRYEVTVYHPKAEGIQVLNVTDPYSVSLTTNSRFSRFVNLNDDDLKPAGWDNHNIPVIENWEDAVIYEGHIRDFSARDQSVSAVNRGKYLAFTENGSKPVEHLRKLAEKGVTHFHMLPANDIASIEEDTTRTVDLQSTLADLCKWNKTAAICRDNSQDKNVKLGELLASYDTVSEAGKAQELVNEMRNFDQFNWGYDPFHFNAPEGSYSSDPEGIARIKEMRAMNQALHGLGLRVALDVVYNHTNASELFSKSVLDKVVPGYYHRYELDTGAIVRETCCDDTEPRNAMMEKLMLDSLLLWTEQYKFDSFRFDIMSQASKATMVRLRDAVQAVDTDNYFYGEGWTRTDRGYEQANQPNMAGTQIGTFNDRIREAVRQGEMFKQEAADSALAAQDKIKMSLAGTLSDYVLKDFKGVASKTSALGGYAKDPADIINYVSKHDNETLWDQLQYSLPGNLTLAQRVRAQNMAATLPLMAQGIPFLQMGGDFLRSKSMDRNTYDAGDWFNYVDFTFATNNWNVGLPLAQDNKNRWEEIGLFMNSPERAATMSEMEFASQVFDEMLSIRSGSKLFRLTTEQDIINRVGFHNIGKRQTQGLIVMSIDDGIVQGGPILEDLDPNYDAVVVVINSSNQELSHTVKTATGFELHAIQMASTDPIVRSAGFNTGEGEGTFTVPAMTTAVFVKAQNGAQGVGLSATATAGAPDVVPYGSTTVFLRGTMNSWGATDAFSYKGAGVYEIALELEAGQEYAFKFASEDWSTVNFGGKSSASVDRVLEEGKELALGQANDNNLMFTPAIKATYVFSVDASDSKAPVMKIANEEPFVGTTVYLRGSMNGWGTDNAFSYDGGRIYTVAMQLSAQEYQFKVASENWSTVNLGAVSGEAADKAVTPGAETALGQADNNNLVLNISEAGRYVFVFDNTKLSEPVIKVFPEQFFGTTQVFLRGSMNGWGTGNELLFNSADRSYSVQIQLDSGEAQFKVASQDWSTVNFGAVSAAASDKNVTLGTAKTLGQADDNNLVLDVPLTGTYRFVVSGPDAKAPKVTVTEVK